MELPKCCCDKNNVHDHSEFSVFIICVLHVKSSVPYISTPELSSQFVKTVLNLNIMMKAFPCSHNNHTVSLLIHVPTHTKHG